mmetsp:Transcript_40839/g.94752  ORF Transcript_40839/g.94752 Transcript_40839/m.94752 type:complete len:278 (-) Transcript_40839:638-1471(-)
MPPVKPSGCSRATAAFLPGKVANAVGRRGTAPDLLQMTVSEMQWKFFLPVATTSFDSAMSNHPAPIINSLTSTGALTSPFSNPTLRTQSSKEMTHASGDPPKLAECATTCCTPFPIVAFITCPDAGAIAREPSVPPYTKHFNVLSKAKAFKGPCVPLTVPARDNPSATSHKRRRPSRQTEMTRVEEAQDTPTCMSIKFVPTALSATCAAASLSQMRSFLSPPAVAQRAESGDQAIAQKLPERPSGFANSFTNSPSLPSYKHNLESEPAEANQSPSGE